MEIQPKFDCVDGTFNTETGELICVQKAKYGEVDLCFKENMYIPFEKIRLHSKDTFKDATETMEEAYKLGQ